MALRRAAPVALAVAVLAGCGGVEPNRAAPPVVAIAFGQEIARLDAQLAGVARAEENAQTRKAATDLWERTIRTAVDLPKRLDAVGPIGSPLLLAAQEARAAARALQGPTKPPAADAVAEDHLRRSQDALRAAADALAPRVPPSSAAGLADMRNALPPPS